MKKSWTDIKFITCFETFKLLRSTNEHQTPRECVQGRRIHKDTGSAHLGLTEPGTGQKSSARIVCTLVRTECSLCSRWNLWEVKRFRGPYSFTNSYSISGSRCSQKRLKTDPPKVRWRCSLLLREEKSHMRGKEIPLRHFRLPVLSQTWSLNHCFFSELWRLEAWDQSVSKVASFCWLKERTLFMPLFCLLAVCWQCGYSLPCRHITTASAFMVTWNSTFVHPCICV